MYRHTQQPSFQGLWSHSLTDISHVSLRLQETGSDWVICPLCSEALKKKKKKLPAWTCRLKPLELLPPAPHGSTPARSRPDQAERGETLAPLWGCSLTALFIFNCQRSLLILSSPLTVIRSVGVQADSSTHMLCTLSLLLLQNYPTCQHNSLHFSFFSCNI